MRYYHHPVRSQGGANSQKIGRAMIDILNRINTIYSESALSKSTTFEMLKDGDKFVFVYGLDATPGDYIPHVKVKGKWYRDARGLKWRAGLHSAVKQVL